jgi:hypothetical protein
MRSRVAIATVCVVGAVVVWAGTAQAKGPSGATLTGPGIGEPVELAMSWERDSIVEDTGLMYALWAHEPDPMLDRAPAVSLGSRYAITWEVPGPDGRIDVVVQDFYPYADGGPLLYTEPGTAFTDGQRAHGGWYRAPNRLLTTVHDLGVPEPAATAKARTVPVVPVAMRGPPDDGVPWLPIGASVVVVIATIALLRTGVRRRRAVVPPS